MDRCGLVVLCVLVGGLGAAGSAAEADTFACGQIPATRVFDVQWSGDENQVDQACSHFQMPYDPRTHSRLQVDVHDDYFELVVNESGDYALQQFDERGTLKFELCCGEVKLANADVVFYIIDGWYGTIITRSSGYSYGDAATFTGLRRDPALSCGAEYAVTSGYYTEVADHAGACAAEFGASYRVVDWAHLEALGESSVNSLMDDLGVPTTFNQSFYYVTRDGAQFYSGSRVYFFERHAGSPPSNWLVHAAIGDITLGSWYDISGQVLCMTTVPTAPTTTIPDGDSLTTPDGDSLTPTYDDVLEASLSAQAVASVAAHAVALVALIANMWMISS